ncbi:MAG: hypothetical protein M1832_003514 [Thelocarpon impressellum]|nr:MAG: hypothetical protein M1832_003514 [Thelocarpon impressellum]
MDRASTGADPTSISPERHANGDGNDARRYVSQVVEALEAVHGSRTSNETRKQASAFLEQARTHAEAPYHGFTIAADKSQPPVARHYALSLLEHAVRHNWPQYSDEQALALRQWIIRLAQDIDAADPFYLRNKIAQLWVEVAKRSWAAQWMDMDELLVRLWASEDLARRALVAVVLEGLSEDVFNREDATATLRGSRLSKACVDIFTPTAVLLDQFPNRSTSVDVRYGEEGWLRRLGEHLRQLSTADPAWPKDEQVSYCAVKVLAALKAAVAWSIPRAIAAADCVPNICRSLASSNIPAQLASVDALHALYSRSHYQDDEFIALVCPMYTVDSVNLLRKLYQWSITDAADINEEKYQLAKKFSEMVSNLGNFVEERPLLIPDATDLPGFLNLLLEIMGSQSLTISIPILNTWVKLLASDVIGGSDAISPLIGPLLEICSQRLIRYESLPEDSDDPSFLYLGEDIDTMPERHAFLGNYRRYCVQVVEIIVRRKPFEAMYHILGQVDQSLQTLYNNQPPFRVETYSKSSVPLLRVDAHFSVVESALKGYMKWRMAHGTSPQRDELERITMEANLESWCERLLDMAFEDPLIRKRILQLGVAFSTSALDKKADFMLKVLKHILVTRPVDDPRYLAYSEAVKDLQNDCSHELRRLAMKMPDYLMTVYDNLELKINEIIATNPLEARQRISFYSFLFIITQRSTTIDPEVRERRLQSYAVPIREAWQNAGLEKSLQSYKGFCELAGVAKVQQYLVDRRVHEIQDWSSYRLDDEGKAIQAEMEQKFQQLPLAPTKGFLGVSVERVRKGSKSYNIATALWHDIIPVILPNLLKLLSYAHAFHNPSNWAGLPEDMQSIVSRTLTDRFWQAGISPGSKDEFYARVSGTKVTLEGFASSVRGAIRTIREMCYSIIFCMSRLDVHFYGFAELPTPLADALFTDAKALSSHQLSTMLSMIRFLVDDCPVALRAQFLPQILSRLFAELDSKVTSEWDELGRRAQASSEDDNLTNEMKEESILRQLTNSSVLLVAGLLDPQRENPPEPGAPASTSPRKNAHVGDVTTKPNSMRAFVLSSLPILHPLMMFCTHALHMRDSRSCGIVIRVLSSIVPDFVSDSATDQAIREHISSAVLKEAITSLHDGYFVELQKDLAQLIATVYLTYAPLTRTPHQILLSLPTITETRLDAMASRLFAQPSTRLQRALVLDLLDGLRGVSVSEQGKLAPPDATAGRKGGTRERERSGMFKAYVSADEAEKRRAREGSADLSGVADMFS